MESTMFLNMDFVFLLLLIIALADLGSIFGGKSWI